MPRLHALPGMRTCEIHEIKGKDHVRYTGIRVLWWPSIVHLLRYHKDQACRLVLTGDDTWRMQFMPVAYARKEACPQSLDQWLAQQSVTVQTDSRRQHKAKRHRRRQCTQVVFRRVTAKIASDCSVMLSDLLWLPGRVCSLEGRTLGGTTTMSIVVRSVVEPSAEEPTPDTPAVPSAKKPRVMTLPKTSQFMRVPNIE